mgnify:CR=1 FL=1
MLFLWLITSLALWNKHLNIILFKLIAESFGAVCLVSKNNLGTQSFNKRVCLSNICTGTFSNNDSDRHTMHIHSQMYPGVEPPFVRPSDSLPPFAPAAWGMSLAICGIYQTPLEVRHIHQMRQNFFPYSFVTPTTKTAGRSRQGAPVRRIQNTALINSLLSLAFPP